MCLRQHRPALPQPRPPQTTGPAHILVGVRYCRHPCQLTAGQLRLLSVGGRCRRRRASVYTPASAPFLEGAGNHASFVPGTTRQLSTVTLLAGPRYTVHLGRRHSLFAQGISRCRARLRRRLSARQRRCRHGHRIRVRPGGCLQLPPDRTIELRRFSSTLCRPTCPTARTIASAISASVHWHHLSGIPAKRQPRGRIAAQ